MVYAPTTIDLSRLPAPEIVVLPAFEAKLQDFLTKFIAAWNAARLKDPTLPEYDVADLETDPIVLLGEAATAVRLDDHQYMNDQYRALLAPLAKGSNLDIVAGHRNLQRHIVPATANTPERRETDESLLERYLLSFDKPAAGSVDRLMLEARTAWPQLDNGDGLHDVRVNGFDVHGRRGDIDVVIIGPAGRAVTEEERQTIRAAVTASHVKPEAVSIAVLPATRLLYDQHFVIELPKGPSPEAVVEEAERAVRAAAWERMRIGGEVPEDLLKGKAYVPSVLKVRDLSPFQFAGDEYTVPILNNLTITPEVRP